MREIWPARGTCELVGILELKESVLVQLRFIGVYPELSKGKHGKGGADTRVDLMLTKHSVERMRERGVSLDDLLRKITRCQLRKWKELGVYHVMVDEKKWRDGVPRIAVKTVVNEGAMLPKEKWAKVRNKKRRERGEEVDRYGKYHHKSTRSGSGSPSYKKSNKKHRKSRYEERCEWEDDWG